MNKIFVQDFNTNDFNCKIYRIDKEESLKYFNTSNKNNVTNKELNLPETEIEHCNYINLSNKIIYSIMKDECIEFLNIYDNKFYEVYNTFFNIADAPIILYYCNKNDPFIVAQTSGYMDFHYVYYVNKKEIIEISPVKVGPEYFLTEMVKTINYANSIINPNLHVNNFKKYLFFGFTMNVGHHLWNEVSALYYFLENKDYYDKIHGIIIGPSDPFNIECILRTKYTNFNIIKFTDIFGSCCRDHYKNLNDIFPVFLNNFFIDKNIKNLLGDNNIISNDIINDNNILEISIDIRTFSRHLINQDTFYTNLIKKMLNDYKNYIIKINFLGYFQTNTNIININTNEECIAQNKIVCSIIQNFNEYKNIIFNNFIGDHFSSIKNNTIKSKLFLATCGTCSSNLLNWIYNVKTLTIGPVEAYDWIVIQYDVLKNYDATCSPKEYTLTNNGLQEPFNIDFDLYYEFFKNKLNELL
jgi:hypothetical protein